MYWIDTKPTIATASHRGLMIYGCGQIFGSSATATKGAIMARISSLRAVKGYVSAGCTPTQYVPCCGAMYDWATDRINRQRRAEDGP